MLTEERVKEIQELFEHLGHEYFLKENKDSQDNYLHGYCMGASAILKHILGLMDDHYGKLKADVKESCDLCQ